MRRFSSNAPQLMDKNGMTARRLRRWMAPAVSSLPVPVSPMSSTSSSTDATRRMRSRSRVMAGLSPTSSSNGAGSIPAGRGTGGSRRTFSRSRTVRRCSSRALISSSLESSAAIRLLMACLRVVDSRSLSGRSRRCSRPSPRRPATASARRSTGRVMVRARNTMTRARARMAAMVVMKRMLNCPNSASRGSWLRSM